MRPSWVQEAINSPVLEKIEPLEKPLAFLVIGLSIEYKNQSFKSIFYETT